MKRTLLALALTTCLSAQAATFNYHGNLQDAGKPADGKYDIELTLYSAADGGKVVAGPLTVHEVSVHDGSFNTEVDFPSIGNVPQQAWLGVRVRGTGDSEFAALGARASVGADAIASSVCPGAWTLDGNAGNASGSFLGTVDASSLVFKTNNTVAATTFKSANGPVPVWLGGLFNMYLGQGGFVGGGGGTAANDTANANVAYDFSVVGGGQSNAADGDQNLDYQNVRGYAFVGGGRNNVAHGNKAAIAGGFGNAASGYATAIGGGSGNTASGAGATIPGGEHNTASGIVSLAAGWWAHAAHDGAFVWADESSSTPFPSTAPNQFDIRATGGVGINTTTTDGTHPLSESLTIAPGSSSSIGVGSIQLRGLDTYKTAVRLGGSANYASSGYPTFAITSENQDGTSTLNAAFLHSNITFNGAASNGALAVGTNGSNGNGAYLTSGGTWTNASSRTFKDGFASVDVQGVLDKLVAMPVQTWFYKQAHGEGLHMGPVAEDFAAAFGLGNDEKHIGTVDESGVAFAAIQGLNEKLEAENAALHTQLDALSARLSALEHGRKGE